MDTTHAHEFLLALQDLTPQEWEQVRRSYQASAPQVRKAYDAYVEEKSQEEGWSEDAFSLTQTVEDTLHPSPLEEEDDEALDAAVVAAIALTEEQPDALLTSPFASLNVLPVE